MGDGTVFQFQPYTEKNALELSSDSGVSTGTLTLTQPALYSRIAIIANSANATGTSAGKLTLTFTDGSTFVTNYSAPDWFTSGPNALGGVERINLTTGVTQGAPNYPCFYQTTIQLSSVLGSNNKPLASLTFAEAMPANATAIYAISGELASQVPASITEQPVNATANEFGPANFSALVSGNPLPVLQWYQNNVPIPGATNSTYAIASTSLTDNGALFKLVAANVVSNVNYSVTSIVVSLTVNAINTPIAASGYNLDLVVESNAAGPPFNSYAVELNPGEGNAYYQKGLPGYSYGLPASGSFYSPVDGTLFQFQPYTASNALVMSSDSGISSGTLTLNDPQMYQSIAFIANSADGDTIGPANVTLVFEDGTTFTTTYYAPDWFTGTANIALRGVERISLSTGTTSGAPDDPQFYQTTLNLASLLGAANKPLAALVFGMPQVSSATAIYALSGILATSAPPYLVTQPANLTVTEVNSATFSAIVAGNPYPSLQWYFNGVPVTGATNSTFTIPAVPLSDNGGIIQLIASSTVSNVTYQAASSNAVLTVLQDTNPPVLEGAESLGLAQVEVNLSKRITANTATNTANYSLAGPEGPVSVLGAMQDVSESNVVLSVAPLVNGSEYLVTVNHLTDQTSLGNVIASNSQTDFIASIYLPAAIGNPFIGSQTAISNGLILTSSGSAIGGTADQFQFASQSVSGDFDYEACLAKFSLSDTWAKAGLVARETLSPGGRFAASLATPSINGCFFEWRDPISSASQSAGRFPDNYPNTWLRLSRVGNVFSGYASYDGQTWTLLYRQSINMSNQLYVGFAVDSDVTNQSVAAQFVDVSNTPPDAAVGTVAYPYEPLAAASRTTPIVISEIMWKPPARADGKNLECLVLYNSNPWFQDISGYQLTCADMNYTFAGNTIIPGGGSLVVAADPGDVEAVYGITNVVGPYNGSLKKSEDLELLDEQGSVLLTVPYSDTFPWPVATDGTGHSLVLANPSYGEGDPRAWTISDTINNCPGQGECFHPSPLRNVVINEILPHSENPAVPQFIELYNHSTNSVDLSGCILTDDPTTNKFVIPNGTSIPPAGFAVFYQSQFGFTLNGAGETLYFIKPDGSRILDAVQFGGQGNGISYGRWPDGANDFYELATNTPGTNNSDIVVGDIVINELMYDPISGNDADQYIELYNKGTNTVNMAGWQFTEGVTFTFPAVSIPPNGYLVVAKDMTNLFSKYLNLNSGNTVGDYSGKLSHNGELLELDQPESLYGTNILVEEDEVSYGIGGRWGEWSSGGGSSLELIDPHANHRLAANWADSIDSSKSVWTNVQTTGVLDNGANYDPSIDYAQIGILDVGECLVDNVQVIFQGSNYVSNSTFETGATNWSFQGCMVRSSIDSPGYNSSYALHIRSSDKFWTGENSCQVMLNSNQMAAGDTVTLQYEARWLHGTPEPDLRLNGNWLEDTTVLPVPNNLGSPGEPNSTYITNAGPAIYNVTHNPPVPAANQAVVVTANVSDPDGVQNLTLYYRLDPSPNYTAVLMNDGGTNGDAIPRDGVYSAMIPGQASNQIVAFYISASDRLGATSRFPALRPWDNEPVRECVVMFGDGDPGGSFGVYHVWLTQTNVNRWSNLADLSNEGNDFTFVYDDNRVIYDAQGHYSGSPFHQLFDSPDGNLCAYKWEFPDDDKFLGATDFNKIHQPGNSPGDDPSLQREQTTWTFMRALGVPWGYRRFVAVYVNGNRRGSLMEDAQVPDSDMVKQYFPNDTGGYLYKMQPWFEFAPAPSGYSIDTAAEAYCYLLPFTTTGGAFKPARYRYNFEVRRTPDSYSNFTNVFSLVAAANSSSSANYVASMENLANMEEWMRVFAANHAAGNLDSFGTEISQNMYGYIGVNGTKYTLMPWDLNIDLGGPQSWAPGQNLLTYDPSDPNMGVIYHTPAFLRMYWRAQQELVNGPLNVSLTTGPLLNAKYNAFIANGLTVENPNSAIIPWISAAQSSIAAQLAAVNATSFSANPTVSVTNNMAYLTGQAPVNVETILVNGSAYPVTWVTLTNWMIAIPLHNGVNLFDLSALDHYGNVIDGDTASVSTNYSDILPSPVGKVVINEIMYSPLNSAGQFIELYNTATNVAFDLSGWQLQGPGYTFPAGSVIGPAGFLVLAANIPEFDADYGATNPIFDVFTNPLVDSGETISLVEPGETNVTVTAVQYQDALPWPTNAIEASLELIDPHQDNWRVGNWAVASSPPFATPGSPNGIATSLTPFPPLWINEVEAQNVTGITNRAGQRVPWLELYNPSGTNVPLSGLYLADNYTNLLQSAFPSNAVINAGEFAVIFADAQTNLSTTNELHTSFMLSPVAGSVALTRLLNGSPQVLDYVNYSNLPPDCSYGSYPDGQSFVRQIFSIPTPGGPNNGTAGLRASYILYATPGAVYSQNFDALPNPGAISVDAENPVTVDGITYSLADPFDFASPAQATGDGGLGIASLAGWFGYSDLTPKFGATDGDEATGGAIDFGDPNSANRALGLLATSSTGGTAFGARFVNAAGINLPFININFVGELWRQSNKAKTVQFYYFIDPSNTNIWPSGVSDYLPALNINFPTTNADSGGVAVEGNAAMNQTNLSVQNVPISNWPPGSSLWLVWQMTDDTGKAQGLAIDDFSFSASAFPAGFTAPPVSFQLPSSATLTVSCPTVNGLTYQLEYNDDLNSTNWIPFGAPVPGTGNGSAIFNIGITNQQRYFRLQILN